MAELARLYEMVVILSGGIALGSNGLGLADILETLASPFIAMENMKQRQMKAIIVILTKL